MFHPEFVHEVEIRLQRQRKTRVAEKYVIH